MSEPIDLAYLCHHWSGPDGAYNINVRHGQYLAMRRDDPAVLLTADSAEDLLEKIREDYASRPVPRRIETDRPQPLDCRFLPEG